MSALFEAVARVFVAPQASAPGAVVAAVAVPAVAVCGPAAEPLACGLALALRRRGPAVVCVWGGAARRPDVPATAAARRLAGSLAARGLAARATGRLVVVTLDREAPVAAAEAGRAGAAAGEAPVAVALCGPRAEAFDALLGAQDLAVVAAAGAPDGVVRLGVDELRAVAGSAVAAPAIPFAAAWCARVGLGATPGARRSLALALDALGER